MSETLPETSTLDVSDAQSAKCSTTGVDSYDMAMHIAALFIVMGCSLFGNLVPFFFKHLASDSLSRNVLTVFKLFGTGVMLSTAL